MGACAPVLKTINYDRLAAELTQKYVAGANSNYIGTEYVKDGEITEEGKKAVSEILVRANVEHDLLAVSMGEVEALREIAKELSKEQWKQFLRGMGVGTGTTIILILIIFLLSSNSSERGLV